MNLLKHLHYFLEAVGKKTSGSIYLHRSAKDTLPAPLLKRVDDGAALVPKTFKWNFIVTTPGYIAYVDAENFDKAHEPVLGARYKVDLDGNVEFVERKNKPQILHQRYKTVKSDYKGFDQDKDRERETEYRKHFDAKAMAGLGHEHKWIEALKKTGIEHKA